MPTTVSRIVEICVFRMVGDQPRFLLLKRSADENIYPGIWQVVTGSIEKGEHTVAAALREVREETGFSPLRLWRLPFVNSFYEPVEDVIHCCPHFAAEAPPEGDPVLSPEHQEFQWCTFEQAQSILPWSGQRTGVGIVHHQIIPGTEESRLLEIHPGTLERKER